MKYYQNIILIIFIIYWLVLIAIAYISNKKNKNIKNFIIADKKLNATTVALGAASADMSSWLLMALPGDIYKFGTSKIWLPLSLIIGSIINWVFIAQKLRINTEKNKNSITIPEYFYNKFKHKYIKIVISIIIILFFILYSIAGFYSGAILIKIIFKIDYIKSLFIILIIIVTYTTIGGFLAINRIDVFQGILILISLIIIPIIMTINLNNTNNIIYNILYSNPNAFNLIYDITIIEIICLISWGIGYIGQPHILIRFMSIKDHLKLNNAKNIHTIWMIISLTGAILIGLIGIAFFKEEIILSNQEALFIKVAQILFNPWISGFLLSAILSAILSTISAIIIMISSIITNDLYKTNNKIITNRIIIIITSIIIFILSINQDKTVMLTTSVAWCGLGASIGPAILFSLYYKKTNGLSIICGSTIGAISVIICRLLYNLKIEWFVYLNIYLLPGFELLIGFIFNSIAIIIISQKKFFLTKTNKNNNVNN